MSGKKPVSLARMYTGLTLSLLGFWGGVVRFILLFNQPDGARFDGFELLILLLLAAGALLVWSELSRARNE